MIYTCSLCDDYFPFIGEGNRSNFINLHVFGANDIYLALPNGTEALLRQKCSTLQLEDLGHRTPIEVVLNHASTPIILRRLYLMSHPAAGIILLATT
jgi:hypothetical protein